jgi:tetratricopeptide (TPR) repeat protein/predicted aspartyl protease
MRRSLIMLAMLGAFGFAGRALADCRLAKLAELPVTMVGLRPMVTVKINGRDAQFVADSGSFYSMISPAAAAEYNLPVRPVPLGGLSVSGVGGKALPSMTTVDSFTLAGIPFPKFQLLVVDVGGGTGLLGQNVFSLGDVEYDLANGNIKLWRADGCNQTTMAYWIHSNTDSYSDIEVSLTTPGEPHTIGSAYLNGVKLTVMFDSGASTSVLTLNAAQRAGITPSSPGVIDGGLNYGIGQTASKGWIGSFPSFKVGEEEIRNARLRFGEIRLGREDMLIGADFFLSHRIYLSRSQHKLFFTYNGGPVFNLTAATPAASKDSAAGSDSPAAASSAPATATATATAAPAAADPADAAEFSRRGSAYAARHDYEHAIAALSRACELAPDNATYFYQRGLVFRDNKQPDLAMADLDRSLELKPAYVPALMARAELRLAARKAEGAAKDLEAAADAADKADDVRLQIALDEERAEQYAQAKVQYGLWASAHPKDVRLAEVILGRCRLGALSGQDLDAALADCSTFAWHMGKSTPQNSVIFVDRGLIRLRMGDTGHAISDFDSALKELPRDASALYGRGVAEQRQGKSAEAKTDMEAATALQPGIADSFRKRGITP